MIKHILDKDGNYIAITAIHHIKYVPCKGTLVLDPRQRPLLWDEEADEEIGKRVRDAIIHVVECKGRCAQLDWDELKQKTPRKPKPKPTSSAGAALVMES